MGIPISRLQKNSFQILYCGCEEIFIFILRLTIFY